MDTNSTNQLISYLNRGGQYGYYWIKYPPEDGSESGQKHTIWYPTDCDLPEFPDGSYDLYYGVHPSRIIPHRLDANGKPKPAQFTRPTLPDIAAINCLFAEFDAKQFKRGKDEALITIERFSLPPTVLVDSGGGYHAYWLLQSPEYIPQDDTFQLNRIREIQAHWVALVGGDPDSKDLCRVLRVPGTYNYKYAPAREVKIEWADFDMPYELSDMTKLLNIKPAPQQPQERAAGQDKPAGARGWLEKALQRVQPGDAHNGRNSTGYWLAQQLVWDGVGETDQEIIMMEYAENVRDRGEHQYTNAEALDSLGSARRLPKRDPAKGNGNGSKPIGATQPAPAQPATKPASEEKPAQPVDEEKLNNILLSASQDHDGHAHCVIELYPNKIAYCEKWGWLVYNGKFWRMDGAEGGVNRAIINTLKKRRIAAVKAEIESLVRITRANSSNVNGVRDILKNYVEVYVEQFDNDPDLLNCANGVLNLRTGELTKHVPTQRFTYALPVEYDPKADPTQWVKFLDAATNNAEISQYLQTAMGYSLTGHTYEEVMFYLYGPPRSGKGTFTETVLAMLGSKPLGAEVDFTTFTATRAGDTQNFDLAPLKPCRFIAASESNKSQPLNPAKIKSMTGRNYIYCAFKRRDHFGYQPAFKIWLSSNNPVNVDVEDDAAWGRVRVIEFPNSHLGTEDKMLKVQMLDPGNLRGVLRWAVDGSRRWYTLWQKDRKGLPLPESVRLAAEKMREQQDTINVFITECCLIEAAANTATSDMYHAYKTWCENNGVPPKYHNQFTQALTKRGHPIKVSRDKLSGKPMRLVTGLGLLA